MAIAERTYARALALAAVFVALLRCLTPPAAGDYPFDAGPALTALAHGHVSGFFSHQPIMGPFALYLRAPFVLLAGAFGDGANGIYRWGCVPCLLALALVAVGLARLAARRGTPPAGQAVIVALCLWNPLVGDALYWGHPEEILTAALALGAVLAALEDLPVATAVLAGLALGTKQWAIVMLLPTVLLLERHRLRVAIGSVAIAGAGYLSLWLADHHSFDAALQYMSHPQPVVTTLSWLWPFSSHTTLTLTSIFGDPRTFLAYKLPVGMLNAARPVLTCLAFGLVVAYWWRSGRRPSAAGLLRVLAIVLLLRCALDPGSAGYYHLPLLLALLAMDAHAGRRLPLAGLAGTAVAFVVVDRAVQYLSLPAANAVYILATVTGLAVLARKPNVGIATASPLRPQQSPA